MAARQAQGTVYVKGMPQLVRAFGQIDKNLRRGIQRQLSDVARIVATDVKEKLSALDPPGSPRTVGGVRPRVRGGTAVVEQRLGKTTGTRSDWGVTQMKRAFLPAVAEKEHEVVEGLESMLDRLAIREGF